MNTNFGLFDISGRIRNYFAGIVRDVFMGVADDPRKLQGAKATLYRNGWQVAPLVVRPGQSDDNIVMNMIGLVVSRTVSLLFGDGVKFDLDGKGESAADEWLADALKANRQSELLHDLGEYGALNGTIAVQFIPDGLARAGQLYPKVLTVNPQYLTILTNPHDYTDVNGYRIEYQVQEPNDRMRNFRRDILRQRAPAVDGEAGVDAPTFWTITDYLEADNGVMEQVSEMRWDKPWAPLLAGKNLPKAGSAYGSPDVTDDVLHLQDKINLVVSNGNKVVRLQAHQRLWGRFLGKVQELVSGPGNILNIENEKGHVEAVPAGGDIAGILSFKGALSEALFSVSRSMDPAVAKDRIGQLTNFGLRVLYKDSIDKLKTKRELYGEFLEEMVLHLLELGGYRADTVMVLWADPLPVDGSERNENDQFELDNKIVSRETVQKRRNVDPAEENLH